MLLLLAPLLLSCSTSSTLEAARCDLDLAEPSPAEASPGQVVSLAARPLTSTWDTAVFVGDQRASGVEISREGCTSCDSCRELAECTACGDCDTCDQLCEETCVETILFQVPDLAAGIFELRVYNAYGQGGAATLQVQDSGGDTGTGGTGTGDTGTGDTGTGDTGAGDTGTSQLR